MVEKRGGNWTVEEYVERTSHLEHLGWLNWFGWLKPKKKQAVLPDGTPYGPRPLEKKDISKIQQAILKARIEGKAVS